jgi:hypothetical protein
VNEKSVCWRELGGLAAICTPDVGHQPAFDSGGFEDLSRRQIGFVLTVLSFSISSRQVTEEEDQ